MNDLHMDIDSLDILNLEIEKLTGSIENIYTSLDNDVRGLSSFLDPSLLDKFNSLYSKAKLHNDSVTSQLKTFSLFLASSISNYELRDNDISSDIDLNNDKLSI